MLKIRALRAGYGEGMVLDHVDADVRAGEIVAVLGRNGSGRSTLAKAIMGLLPWRGQVEWAGHSLARLQTFEIARLGIGYVPESRDIFTGMTVHQNLLMGLRSGQNLDPRRVWQSDTLYRMFPALAARRDVDAAVLSGGEQQMLALCRCLMGSPCLVIVDEPTEGLAPALVAQVADCLQELRRRGGAVLMMEQKRVIGAAIADRVLVMGQGRVVFDGLPARLQEQPASMQEWLQV